jgi:hypothetical protein
MLLEARRRISTNSLTVGIKSQRSFEAPLAMQRTAVLGSEMESDEQAIFVRVSE